MLRHPPWYFEHFDELFGASRNYEAEVAIVARHDALPGTTIEEIGAGTGNHIVQLLKHGPRSIAAVDADPQAIDLLLRRFRNEPRVKVEQGDGFARDAPADLVLIYYCILQQFSERSLALEALRKTFSRVQSGLAKVIWFEWIDVGIHLQNNDGRETVMDLSRGRMRLRTDSSEEGAILTYSGRIDGQDTRYVVTLSDLGKHDIADAATAHGLHWDLVPLSSSLRRNLVRIWR